MWNISRDTLVLHRINNESPIMYMISIPPTPNALPNPSQTPQFRPSTQQTSSVYVDQNHPNSNRRPRSNLNMPRSPIRLIPLPAIRLLRARVRGTRVIISRLGVLVGGIALLLLRVRVCGLGGVARVFDQVVHLRVVGANIFPVALATAAEAAPAVLVVDDACVDEEAEEGESDGGEGG